MAAAARDGEREAATRLLPRELLAAVFALLEVPDRCCASGVCRRWRVEALGEPRSIALQLCILETRLNGEEDGSGTITFEQQRKRAAEFHRRLQLQPPRTYVSADSGYDADLPALAPLPRFAPILTAAEAARFLRRPVCASVRSLVMRLVLSDATPGPSWGLATVAPALPAGLERLELILPYNLIRTSAGNRAGCQAVSDLALHESAPLLRELVVPHWRLDLAALNEHDPSWLPSFRHPRLELLRAILLDWSGGGLAQLALRRFPSLRRVSSLSVICATESCDLGALAATGVRAGRITLSRTDLSSPAAVGSAFGPDAGRPSITLVNCSLPDDWPGAFPAGLQSISVAESTLRPSALSWLFRGPHAATLSNVHLGFMCAYAGLRPGELLAAFEGLPSDARLRLWFPPEWADEEPFAELLRTLVGSERLLRAVNVLPPALEAGDPRAAAWQRYEAARARPPSPAAGGRGLSGRRTLRGERPRTRRAEVPGGQWRQTEVHPAARLVRGILDQGHRGAMTSAQSW